jgi:Major capsid protein Gp23
MVNQNRVGLLKEERNIKKDIYTKWEKYKLLDNINDEVIKENTALVLETMRVENQKDFHTDISQFKRVSVPLARRVFPNLIAHDIVSVQPLLAQHWFHRYFKENTEHFKPVVAISKKLKTQWPFSLGQSDRQFGDILAHEAELTSILAEDLRLEIDREIISDLLSNASFKLDWHFEGNANSLIVEYKAMWNKIIEVAEDIGKSINRSKANWVIASPEVCSALLVGADSKSFGMRTEANKIKKVDTINGINLYSDPLFQVDTILIGYRGLNEYDAGYFYCPYRLIQMGEGVDNAFFPRKSLLTIRAKRFCTEINGKNFYTVLKIDNWV